MEVVRTSDDFEMDEDPVTYGTEAEDETTGAEELDSEGLVGELTGPEAELVESTGYPLGEILAVEDSVCESVMIVDDGRDEISLLARELPDDAVDTGWDTDIETDPVEMGTNDELGGVSVGRDEEVSVDSVDVGTDEETSDELGWADEM